MPSNTSRPIHRSRFQRARRVSGSGPRAGFTVTELLVVIAIIAVLVGLLLAALNAARQRSQISSTQATMEAFRAGCEAFLQAQRQLPGAIPEDVLIRDAAGNGGIPQISAMENALLHLMGGYAISVDTPNPDPDDNPFYTGFTAPSVIQLEFEGPSSTYYVRVDINRLGEGPRIGGKQFEPYFTPTPGTLLVVSGQVFSTDPDAPDPGLPDLVDAWGQPISFLRQSRPLGPLVKDPGSSTIAQFDPTGMLSYLLSNELGRLSRDQEYDMMGNREGSVLTGLDSGDAIAIANLARIIQNPAFADQARGTFALFSAGPDGYYFSGTDGPGTQTDPVADLTDADLPSDIVGEYDDLLSFGGA